MRDFATDLLHAVIDAIAVSAFLAAILFLLAIYTGQA